MELDEDTLDRLRRFCGRDPRKPETVTREVFSEYGSAEWSLPEFLTIIANVADAIPAALRPTAVVRLEGGYEESTELKITYEDTQTPEEVAAHLEWCLSHIRADQARERETFARLKAKFEPSR